MNGDLDFKMIMRFIDQASGPMVNMVNKMENAANRMHRSMNKASGVQGNFLGLPSQSVINDRIAKAERMLQRAQRRLMTAGIAAAIVIAPIIKLAKFEHNLAHFANISDMTIEQVGKVADALRASASDVNQSASDLLEGLSFLMGKGLSEGTSLTAIDVIGKAATATGATVDHMSAASYAVIKNLGIEAVNLGRALDMMAMSGKLGGFELKDMAQYFPGITAAAKNLGIQGEAGLSRLTAALQVAITGASDPAQAANNFQNFLVKMTSPETVNKFKKMGIDIRKEMDNAVKNGIDPMEYMLVRMHDLAETNKHVIGDVFGDMQVQAFLKPLIANLEDYRNYRDQTLTANGVIDKDFGRVMDTLTEQWKKFVIELGNTMANGEGVAGILKDIVKSMTSLVTAVNEFAIANPELAGGLVELGGALTVFAVGSAAAQVAWASGKKAIWSSANVLTGIDKALQKAKNLPIGILKSLPYVGLAAAAVGLAFEFMAEKFDMVEQIAQDYPAEMKAVNDELWGTKDAANAAGEAIETLNSAMLAQRAIELQDKLSETKEEALAKIKDATTTDFFDNTGNDLTKRGKQALGPVLQSLTDKLQSGNLSSEDTSDASNAITDYSLQLIAERNAAYERYNLLKIKRESSPNFMDREFVKSDERNAKSHLEKISEKIERDLAVISEIKKGINAQTVTQRLLEQSQKMIADIQERRARITANGGRDEPVTNVGGIPVPLSRQQSEDAANAPVSQSSEDVISMLKGLLDRAQSMPSADGGKGDVVQAPQNVDQSKHVQQTNHINVTVNGAPATAGNAAVASLKAATTQALRDTD